MRMFLMDTDEQEVSMDVSGLLQCPLLYAMSPTITLELSHITAFLGSTVCEFRAADSQTSSMEAARGGEQRDTACHQQVSQPGIDVLNVALRLCKKFMPLKNG